jgi:DNA-binding NarL/FixJ family response regulator
MSAERVGVVVVDDQQLFSDGLVRIVEDTDDLSVVGVARDAQELDALPYELDPSVVVLDYRLAQDTALDVVPIIGQRWPAAQVLVVTGYDSERTRQLVIAAGCAGLLSKGESSARLLDAIRGLAAGRSLAVDAAPATSDTLTARELEVLALLAQGYGLPEIAERLYIGVVTVRNHVQHILRKLDASSQLEAVIIGMRHGLVDPPA